MQQDLAARVSALRFPHSELAKAAGLDKNTVTRALKGRSILSGSLQKIEAVVAADEIRLRDYLLARHPLPAERKDAA
jgi:transcriptional regulator with XRE-family HTH domain